MPSRVLLIQHRSPREVFRFLELFKRTGSCSTTRRCNTLPELASATETPKAMTTEDVVTMVFHSAVRAINQARKKVGEAEGGRGGQRSGPGPNQTDARRIHRRRRVLPDRRQNARLRPPRSPHQHGHL